MFDWASLVEAGPWAILVATGGSLGIAFVRGWIVAKPLFDREVTRSEKLDGQLDRMTESFEKLSREIREARLVGGRHG